MTIEGLGKKFQEARLARGLTLDEAARMTKIRPTRLAEIEADDFSQFPSLAYAKGFLQIYGKFLDVDVAPYLEAFETSEHVTIDGYSYLQEEPAPMPVRSPVVRRRPSRPAAPSRSSSSSGSRPSLLPVVIGIVVIVLGIWIGNLVQKILRVSKQTSPAPTVGQTAAPALTSSGPYTATATTPAPAPATSQHEDRRVVANTPPPAVSTPMIAASAPPAATIAPAIAAASPQAPPPQASVAPSEPEVRRAEPVRAEDLTKAAEPTGPNRIAIRPLKKTYIKVVVDNEKTVPAFERWVSPSDGTLEFRGERVAIRVLDRDAIQIKKNGKSLPDDDSDVTIE
jgi:cytoskeletal protein RodZ